MRKIECLIQSQIIKRMYLYLYLYHPCPHQNKQHQILRNLEHTLVQRVELVKDVRIRKKLVGFAAKYIKYSR